MTNIVIRLYDDFTAAEQARAALLHAGFGESNVQLTTREDEAGPVRGNFVLPSKDSAPDGDREARGFFGSLFSGRPAPRTSSGGEPNSRARQNRPAQVARHGTYLLMVDARDAAQHAHAAAIMSRYGARDVEQHAADRPRSR